MKNGIGNIFVTWRKGKGFQRIVVGVIKNNKTESASFRYAPEGVKSDGFIRYTGFPNLEVVYHDNVLEIFGQRLNKSEREDIQKYYDFWEIDPKNKDDKFYLLAHTQGIVPTDNFEFLADYSPVLNLKFVSEACGLSVLKLPPDTIQEGDVLRWEREPNNEYDKYAVKVFKDDTLIGYVKTIHSKVFYKKGSSNLKVVVKSISRNGYLNRVFIKIFC